jgi:hypothetical protein
MAAAAAILLLTATTAGCSELDGVGEFVNGKDCTSGPVVYTITDVSDSTKALRRPAGLYETGVKKVIAETARDCGELYAAPLVDGNAIGNTAGWTIDGTSFREITLGGNSDLGAAAREKKATEELGPKVRTLLTTKSTNGSDALGALRRVALAADSTANGRHKQLVIFFDGVLNLPGHYSLYKTPIDTPERLTKFIDRLKRGGEIPDLKGFDVYIAGLGVGVSNRETAKAVITFWERLIPLTGARLRSADASLRYP